MGYHVGQVLYWCIADEDTGACEIAEYHVRTIRGGFVHAIWKIDGVTWGKRSTKSGDYGWLPSIPAFTRSKWDEIAGFTTRPSHLHTTRLAAIKHAIKECTPGKFITQFAYDKAAKTLKAMETRARTARKKKDQKL